MNLTWHHLPWLKYLIESAWKTQKTHELGLPHPENTCLEIDHTWDSQGHYCWSLRLHSSHGRSAVLGKSSSETMVSTPKMLGNSCRISLRPLLGCLNLLTLELWWTITLSSSKNLCLPQSFSTFSLRLGHHRICWLLVPSCQNCHELSIGPCLCSLLHLP